ncbi:MAG: AAA family ATPase, partial [Firmicutes bacterium]|nr:AAA family ATPase [Bacillota bacterium]
MKKRPRRKTTALRQECETVKELTRIRLINWHYFENETVEIKGSTLITGDNGSGKSTILDAIQYVLVADLRNVKFNVSASEETRRDLLGYVRCKTGSDGEGGRCLRHGDITSYVVLEFYDDMKRKHFLLGVAVDSYADGGTWESKFFKVEDSRLDDALFLAGKRPRNIRELKVAFKALKDKKARLYPSVEEYREDLLAKLGGLRSDRFFNLLVKAISFKPITDIRQFVYSYVLEEKHVNIEVMKENFLRYKEYSDLAARTREKIVFLQRIMDVFSEIEREQQKVLVQEYLIRRGNWEHLAAEGESVAAEVAGKEKELAEAAGELLAARQEEVDCQDRYDRYRDTLASNSTFQLTERLKGEINDLAQKRQELEHLRSGVMKSCAGEVARLEELLRDESGLTGPEEKMSLRALAGLLRTVAAGGLPAGPDGASGGAASVSARIGEGMAVLETLERRFSERAWEVDRQVNGLAAEEKKLQDELASLRNKKFVYDRKVTELRDLIAERFRTVKGIAVEPKVLCELLEVPDEKWQDAVEGWLNTQRFDLIVEPEHFDFALSVYERHKMERRIAGVGLVNTGKVLKYLDRVEPGSLAGEVRSENRYALAYVRQLMGSVIKCENEQQLKEHRRAITPTCMTYVNNTARQIKFEVYETPFIGERAYARQIARKEARLAEVKPTLAQLRGEGDRMKRLAGLCSIKDGRYAVLQDRLRVFGDLEEIERLLVVKQKELDAVDTSGIDEIQYKMEALRVRALELRSHIEGLVKKQGKLESLIGQLKEKAAELALKEREARALFNDFVESHREAAERGAARYEKERRRRPPAAIAANFLHNQKSLEPQIARKQNELTSLKTKYNIDYHFGGRTDPAEVGDYAGEYKKLVESELPEYEEKINQAKREAEQEFKEHFIHKLRENIENARNEFNFLNDALKTVSFGGDSYRFLVEPSARHRRFYEMIMDTDLIEGGVSLFDSLFQDRHREAMDELFDKIINTPADQLSANIAEYTDYRSFMDYDIKITGAGGETYIFSRVCREKSGGETQTPYYVAIVASFVQLYRLKTNRD